MNCRKGKIIEYEISRNMVLYSFILDKQDLCEFDRFISKFDIEPVTKEDGLIRDGYNIVLAAIDEIVKRGAREGRFRGEDNVHAIPAEQCSLRLYCIRLSGRAVLLGNGGRKTSQKLKDSPDCYPHQMLLSALEKNMRQRIQDGEMWWEGDHLKGDMYFELGDCD